MAKFCTQCGSSIEQSEKFCSNCGERIEIEIKESEFDFRSKREKVLNKNKGAENKKSRKLILAVFAIPILLGLLSFYDNLPALTNPIIDEQPVVSDGVDYPAQSTQMKNIGSEIRDGKIIIPLDKVKSEKFVAFNFQGAGKNVPLLAYISGEGKIITAVSMCEPCSSKRFHIKGEQLYCNSCGTTWTLDDLEGVSGACQGYPPDAIPSTVVGNEIQINVTDVQGWNPRV